MEICPEYFTEEVVDYFIHAAALGNQVDSEGSPLNYHPDRSSFGYVRFLGSR